jgi:hypothetical protein
MKISMFKSRGEKTTRARIPAAPRARLEVEALENRLVPTAWIAHWQYPIYNAAHSQIGTLSIGPQTGNTFSGTFHDNGFNVNIPITGQLGPYNGSWDTMSFQGGPTWFGLGYESVSFNGWVAEGVPHTLDGSVTESGTWLVPGPTSVQWVSFVNNYWEYSAGYYPIY